MARYGKTHGMYGTPTYRAWSGMLQRCKRPQYKAKGIAVWPLWQGRNGFIRFFADMGERPPGMTLDRINNNGDYEPHNCRWATWQQQGRNKGTTIYVTCDGVRMSLDDACEAKGLPTQKVKSFVWYATKHNGLSATEAFHQFGVPKHSWVKYEGVMMPIGKACKLAGLQWRPNIDRKAQLEGISLQAAFDHFLSKKILHPIRQLVPSLNTGTKSVPPPATTA